VLKEGIHCLVLIVLVEHQDPVHFELCNEGFPSPMISVKVKELGTSITFRMHVILDRCLAIIRSSEASPSSLRLRSFLKPLSSIDRALESIATSIWGISLLASRICFLLLPIKRLFQLV
jgi:hypothetical protein